VPTQHPWIKPLRKADVLIVRVGLSNGQVLVSDVEHRNKEEAVALWKVEMDKHNTFPGHNLYGPIFAADSTLPHVRDLVEKKLPPVEIGARLAEVMRTSRVADSETQRSRIKEFWNHIYDFPHKELLPLLTGRDGLYGAFEALIRVFDSFERFDRGTIEAFLSQLACVAVQRCRDGRLDGGAALLRDMMIGKWDKARGAFQETTTSIWFDLADYSQVMVQDPVKMSDPRMREFVSQRLLDAESARPDVTTGICSLTGDSGALVSGSLPVVRLPIGDTQLMSMDENAPCHNRYGPLSTDTVFPIGKRASQRLYDVLCFVCPPDGNREGKTWILVPSGKAKPDLLIAYVEEMPNEDFENARLLGGTDWTRETDFESLSSAVCDALKLKVPDAANHHLRLFVIGKPGDGPAQLVLAERMTVQSLFDAVKRWRDCSRNCPLFRLKAPGRGKGEGATDEPICPFPAQVVDLLRYQWIRGGTESHKLEGCKLSEVYEIFFGRERAREAAASLLEKTIQRIGPLLLGIGQAIHKNWMDKDEQKKLAVEARRMTLRAVSVIGILLYELGRRKEDYVKDAAFGVGQLLALADTLHKDYCIVVRDGQIPPSLIGNAMMTRAYDNPCRAIADLADRMPVYTGWAKTAQEPIGNAKEDEQKRIAVREARKTLRLYKPLADSLHEIGLPERCDDKMKAELLLGYLASTKEEKKETSND